MAGGGAVWAYVLMPFIAGFIGCVRVARQNCYVPCGRKRFPEPELTLPCP